MHALAAGAPGVLYTDEVRCPVDVADLAAALLELAAAPLAGTCHVAGADAVSKTSGTSAGTNTLRPQPAWIPFTLRCPSTTVND